MVIRNAAVIEGPQQRRWIREGAAHVSHDVLIARLAVCDHLRYQRLGLTKRATDVLLVGVTSGSIETAGGKFQASVQTLGRVPGQRRSYRRFAIIGHMCGGGR